MQNSFNVPKDKNSDFEEKVIFITGLYKCGTSWLSLALGKHPQIMSLTEIDVVRAFAKEGQPDLEGKDIYERLLYLFSASSYGLLPQVTIQQSKDIKHEKLFDYFESNAQKQILLQNSFIEYHLDRTCGSKISGNGIIIESYLNYWNLDQQSAKKVFSGSLLEPDPTKAIRKFCEVHQKFSGGFCVLKSADQINHIKHIQNVMPGSPKVLIIRDGRDMAISATKFEEHYVKKRTHFADLWKLVETDFWERLGQWKAVARTIHSYKENNEIYVLRYEDLINDFESTITSLLNYLGLDSGVRIVEHMRTETSFEIMSGGRSRGDEDLDSNIRNGVVGEWKQVLDDMEKQKAWNLAGEELRLWGYES